MGKRRDGTETRAGVLALLEERATHDPDAATVLAFKRRFATAGEETAWKAARAQEWAERAAVRP